MIIDWTLDVWTNTHSIRPQEDGCNLLASWHLAQPKSPEIIPQLVGGGDRNAISIDDFPRQRVTHHFIPQILIRVSALRALGAYAEIFAIQRFMDDRARAVKDDPVEFRIRHLNDPRAIAIIKAAATLAGWQPNLPASTGKGGRLGSARYKNLSAYLAVVMDVEVDRQNGQARITRAMAAVDAGQVIDPDERDLSTRLRVASCNPRVGRSRKRCALPPSASRRATGVAIRSSPSPKCRK